MIFESTTNHIFFSVFWGILALAGVNMILVNGYTSHINMIRIVKP